MPLSQSSDRLKSSLAFPEWDAARPGEQEVRELSRVCTQADGCRNLDDGLLWAYLDGRGEGLWDARGRAHLGLCADSKEGRLQLLIHPKWRGRGTGTAWLLKGLEHLRQQGCETARVWAYGDTARTVAWLERLGLSQQRLLFSLSRPASGVAAPIWPAGWSIRCFRLGFDEGAWHHLHLKLQSRSSQGWSMPTLTRQLAEPSTPPQRFWLLFQGETLRGYVWLKGVEIFMFAVDPEVRGQKLGQKLLSWALSQGDGSAKVFCDDQRPAALGLYQKLGFLEVGRDRCLHTLL